MSLIYSSDNSSTGFDATSVSALPTGWNVPSGGGTWSVQTTNALAGHTHAFTNTSKVDGDSAFFTGNGTAADMEVTFAQTMAAGVGSKMPATGVFLRCDGTALGTRNGYLVLLADPASSPVIYLVSYVGGTPSYIGPTSGIGISLSSGDVVLCRAQIIGTAIKARFWKSGSAEPTSWQLNATDTSVSAPGYAGVFSGQDTLSGQVNTASDFNVDSISASQAMMTLAPVQPITASGGNITVSGTYSGTAPGSIGVAVDGGSYTGLGSPSISGGNWSGTITAPASGYHSLNARNTGVTTVTDSGIYDVSGPTSITIAPNNAAIVYSPYNWLVNGTNAVTINAGAYLRTLFTGTSCALTFDVSNMGSPASQIWWRIDYGTWTKATVSATMSLTIPGDTLSNADIPYHLLEVVVKSTTETINRWNTATTGTAVKLTGIVLDLGSSVQAPGVLAKNLLVYGDSITEGVRTVGESATNDTDRNDAMQCWSYKLREYLGCEIGVVGFGAAGYTASGSGSVPALSSAYNLLYSGQTRSFSPAPDLTVINHGVNDGGASSGSITTAVTTVLNGLLGAFASKPIVALAPLPPSYSGSSTVRSAVQAAIANIGNARLSWVDTPGAFSTSYGADSLNIHPAGPNDQGLIAPAIAELLRSTLYPATGGGAAAGGFVIGG